jgi:3-isopropylmalate/(R)-2-methylmalate dehydratase small subunit
MKKTIQGSAYVFGDNIDTDQIYPGRYLELTDSQLLAAHVMEGADPGFRDRFVAGGIIVAGKNFGCGSSREHAVIALQGCGVRMIVAESFARIFFRNSINLGFPLMICRGIRSAFKDGDLLAIDLAAGIVIHDATKEIFEGDPLSPFVFDILQAGGIKPLMKKRFSCDCTPEVKIR